jgi:hypothetical protein
MIQDFYLDYLDECQLEKKQQHQSIPEIKKKHIRRDNFFTIETGLAILDIDIVGRSGFGC